MSIFVRNINKNKVADTFGYNLIDQNCPEGGATAGTTALQTQSIPLE